MSDVHDWFNCCVRQAPNTPRTPITPRAANGRASMLQRTDRSSSPPRHRVPSSFKIIARTPDATSAGSAAVLDLPESLHKAGPASSQSDGKLVVENSRQHAQETLLIKEIGPYFPLSSITAGWQDSQQSALNFWKEEIEQTTHGECDYHILSSAREIQSTQSTESLHSNLLIFSTPPTRLRIPHPDNKTALLPSSY